MPRFGAAAITLLAGLVWTVSPTRADGPPVYVVIFTHVEDNTPLGPLGSMQSRQSYMTQRSNLIAMAALAESTGVQWSLQPDWKLLEAALLYEDSTLRATTNDKNFLRYLKEDRGVVIDPHSHEHGYNYTDVAHLLDSLGVGATTVIGGHVWDPALPEFQEWDRYRVPVQGEHYPNAIWRGDILTGSGTPNHVNDPLTSGVWRPYDRDHYFQHDPNGNITAIGQYKKSIALIQELITLHRSGAVPPTAMLTFSTNINPQTIGAPGGLAAIADTVIAPLVAWRDSGLVVTTDFTTLVHTWETVYGAQGYLYDAETGGVLAVGGSPEKAADLELAAPVPHPVRATTLLRFTLAHEANVRLTIHDIQGRRVAVLAEGARAAGEHAVRWDAGRVSSGVYLCRLTALGADGAPGGASSTRKVLVVR